MPTVSHILQFRLSRRTRENKSPWGLLGLYCALAISLSVLAVLAVGIWYYFDLIRDLPPVSTLPVLLEPPDGELLLPTRLYDRSGQQVILTLVQPEAGEYQYLSVSDKGQQRVNLFSQNLVNATIAALDPGFWHAPAFSLNGVAGNDHPSLAQRLVLDLFLYAKPASQRRNNQEWLLAGQVTAQYGSSKVLEWYLNSAKYGNFIYGADAAARVYLGKSATQLSVAEAALLTSLVEVPGLDPWNAGQLLRDHQVEIIQRMAEDGLISADQAHEAMKENIQLQPERPIHSLAPEFTDLVLKQLSSQLPLERISRGGFEIITTLDYDLQVQATCTTQEQINRLQDSPESPATEKGVECKAAAFLPALQVSGGQITSPNAEVILLEPQSGEILAFVGGNPADPIPSMPPGHPSGSILSPFLYLAGFTQGLSPASLLWDLPDEEENLDDPEILAGYHGPVRLRNALINDYLGAADEVIRQVGVENVLRIEEEFGISSGELISVTNGSQAEDLFSSPVSLLDSVQAYGVLSNQGMMVGKQINAYSDEFPGELSPTSILTVKDNTGRTWLDWSDAQVRPIVNNQLAYLVTNILSDDSARTASMGNSVPLDIGRPAAVKASVTSDAHNTWSIGYIPQLTAGVWLGTTQDTLTTEASAGIWKAVMQYASSKLPEIAFVMPNGINRVKVCDPSGLLVTPTCPTTVEEIFLVGSEPTQVDNLYQEFFIDKQTGLLATIFTPMEQVEKKVYLVVPIEVTLWAKAVHLPLPPDNYDPISQPETSSKDVKITVPSMLDYVNGKVEISGTAIGEDFSYYRLQVGQGLNPQQWVQIGDDMQQPIQDGLLGTWDTTGLDGAYVVELLVVRHDLRLKHLMLPVIVDNNAPQVQILSPKEGQVLSQQAGDNVSIQVKATDNQGVERVEFYIDDTLETTLYQAPYVIPWKVQGEKHTILVKVFDFAGNTSQARISFSIKKQ
jgi:membrane peptidoglycan carboxypeptidase